MAAERLDRRMPAQADAGTGLRGTLVAFAAELGANAAAREAIALAASEAITNVVMHAYVGIAVGDVIVEAWPDPHGHLLVQICDEGIGMRPRTDSPGLGLGIALMARMADDFRIIDRPAAPGLVVSMRFSLHGSGSGLDDDTALHDHISEASGRGIRSQSQ